MSGYFVRIREALIQAYIHDVINTSKAAAYSGMLMFFPALLVITTLVAQVEVLASSARYTATARRPARPARSAAA